jgi:hypothetical protein
MDNHIVLLEKRYLWYDGSPATKWEPSDCTNCKVLPDLYKERIANNPHRDGLGKSLPGGRAAYKYEYRAAEYLPVEGEK